MEGGGEGKGGRRRDRREREREEGREKGRQRGGEGRGGMLAVFLLSALPCYSEVAMPLVCVVCMYVSVCARMHMHTPLMSEYPSLQAPWLVLLC